MCAIHAKRVTIMLSRNRGRDLEFCCTAYPEEISISLKKPEESEDQLAYEDPDLFFLDLGGDKGCHPHYQILAQVHD